ncbi:hypothetical protein TNIN_288971 [Trichonephila inaurata madagascariensis]|uniref:Uncharacterized protein n=1 Tax=Trichonephila inaurata madagascariensis TaxID=2747483 RepID=A0A8X6YN99_9ARAC|nr:hypothetical protein TNIN_288971 [Trichonephila inaurata madagascariensis]
MKLDLLAQEVVQRLAFVDNTCLVTRETSWVPDIVILATLFFNTWLPHRGIAFYYQGFVSMIYRYDKGINRQVIKGENKIKSNDTFHCTFEVLKIVKKRDHCFMTPVVLKNFSS